MANINISVEALICEAPQFTDVSYTGTRFEFNMNWTSNADYYYSIDPTVSMTLTIQLYRPNESNPYYTGNVIGPIPFNANDFMANILDYESEFTTKDTIVFTLFLSGEDSCNTQDIYTIPSETLP